MRVIGRPILGAADFDGVRTSDVVRDYLWSFQTTIAAGTSQIQRNLIAQRILGMPKGAMTRCAGRSASSRFPQSLEVASLLRTVAGSRALARGPARRRRAPRPRRCAAPRRSSRRSRPRDPTPRIGRAGRRRTAASTSITRATSARSIPCFPTYEIRVDGDRASGTVALPDRLRRPARRRPRRLPRPVLRLDRPAPQLRPRGRRQDDLARRDATGGRRRCSPSSRSRWSARSTDRRITSTARLLADGVVLCEAEVSAVAGDRAALPEVSPRRAEA